MTRRELRIVSNNPQNPNKNLCTSAIILYFGLLNSVKYLHTLEDMIKALKNKYKVKIIYDNYLHRNSRFNHKSVGQIRKMILPFRANHYIVRVDEHVLLLNCLAETIIDTDPRKKDRRKTLDIVGVYPKN